MENAETDTARVQAVVDALSEHYDSVQIFVTRHESGEAHGTVGIEQGCGNMFARIGQCHSWLNRMEEFDRIKSRDDADDDDDES
jgi:hypothetical protein